MNSLKNQVIKNIQHPSCTKCVYLKKGRHPEYIYHENSVCMKFGEKSLVTGKIKYSYANTIRYSYEHCGEIGKYFTLKDEYMPTNPLMVRKEPTN